MRTIDNWVGRPLCWLLTQWQHVLLALGLSPTPSAPMRSILFVKLEEQGALVVATPAVKRAERLVGRDNLYFITFDQNRRVLDMMALVPPENVFTIRSESPTQIVVDTLRVLWCVRRLRIDATVDMEFFARGSAILAYLCGSPRRAGLHGFEAGGPYRGDLMTHRVLHNPYLHTADAYDVLVRALERDTLELPMLKAAVPARQGDLPHYQAPAPMVARVKGLLEKVSGEGPMVMFQPNCGDVLLVRRWPEASYVTLGKQLLASDPSARLLLTGLPAERDALAAMARVIGGDRVLNLAGELSLEELLAVMNESDVLVTNDSGPAHFAGLTSVHLVALYGPETPALFGPLGTRTRVLYQSFACSPCLTAFNFRLSPCQDNQCVKSIPVEAVLAAIDDCLRERGYAETET
jgi:ADP-heptose:LPS heptosyltransferase